MDIHYETIGQGFIICIYLNPLNFPSASQSIFLWFIHLQLSHHQGTEVLSMFVEYQCV